MGKKVMAVVKLQCPAGQANPAPPVGPALGQHGVNIMEFCKAFNAKTQDKNGLIIPAEITIYQDRSFTFVLKSPPAAVLLKKAAKLKKGSGEPNRNKVGKVTKAQLLAFFDAHIAPGASGGRRLVTHVFAAPAAPAALTVEAVPADDFYPVPPERPPEQLRPPRVVEQGVRSV